MRGPPVVSIITPCYNAAPYVVETVESVRAQTFVDWEHLVVDDGSTDGSGNIVQSLARSDPRLRLVTFENGGCAVTRNRGWNLASSESKYLCFLDADDLMEPHMLATMAGYMDAHPEVGLSYCDFTIVDEKGELLQMNPNRAGWGPRLAPRTLGWREIPSTEADTPFESIFAITAIIPSVTMFRRSVYEQTPGWDEDIGVIYEDVGLYLHMALRSAVHFIPHKLLRYRRHSTQSSTAVEKFNANLRIMRAKWDNPIGLTAQQLSTVRRAQWFLSKRLGPYQGLLAGARSLRQGRIQIAARFFFGAAWRYASSFILRPE
jgi:GT2 family glycosyltransferase